MDEIDTYMLVESILNDMEKENMFSKETLEIFKYRFEREFISSLLPSEIDNLVEEYNKRKEDKKDECKR